MWKSEAAVLGLSLVEVMADFQEVSYVTESHKNCDICVTRPCRTVLRLVLESGRVCCEI